ncbi:MAG: helix-turn-helix domain-containing protein [Bacteroidales bacterium]
MEEKEIIKEVGAILLRLRNDKGMSVEEVASSSGLSKSTVNRIENGFLDARLSTISRIAKVFGVKITFR